MAALAEWKAGREQRAAKAIALADADAAVVQIRSIPFVGGEKLIAQRIVDDAERWLAVFEQTDRHAEKRKDKQIVISAIERIDDPDIARFAGCTRFLGKQC